MSTRFLYRLAKFLEGAGLVVILIGLMMSVQLGMKDQGMMSDHSPRVARSSTPCASTPIVPAAVTSTTLRSASTPAIPVARIRIAIALRRVRRSPAM